MDVVLAQVIIEGIVLEVALDDAKNLGVSVGQRPRTVGNTNNIIGGLINNNSGILGTGNNFLRSVGTNGGQFPSGSGFAYFGQLNPTWDAALQAVASDSTINVLSRPRVQTSHAIEASLFIGDTVPYVTGTISDINGGARSQYQQLRVGITLNVLPLVNSEGLVVMDISESIQQLGNSVTIDGNPVPTTTERTASAKVAVKDGEPVILGGFISSTKSTSKSGVPYLKDIPILGALFRSKNDSLKRTELIVLLRPTVLKTPQDAANAAKRERTQMPGIYQAEKQYDADEKALKRKAGVPLETNAPSSIVIPPPATQP